MTSHCYCGRLFAEPVDLYDHLRLSHAWPVRAAANVALAVAGGRELHWGRLGDGQWAAMWDVPLDGL